MTSTTSTMKPIAALLLSIFMLPGCDLAQEKRKTTLSRVKGKTASSALEVRAQPAGVNGKSDAGAPEVSPTSEKLPPLAASKESASAEGVADDRESSFDDLIEQADGFAVEGKREAALATYKAAAKRDPKSAVPQVEIARLLIKANKPKEALEHAELAVELAPRWSTAWNTVGRVHLLAGQLEEAAEAFSHATERNTRNIYAWNNLGLVRITQKRFDEAVEALQEATKSANAVAFMFNNLGTAHEHLGRVAEALVAYKRGLALGSGIAGKNFVRLESTQQLEQTAQRSPASEQAETPPTPPTDPS